MFELETLKDIAWTNIDWQNELKNNINSIEKLKTFIDLTDKEASSLEEVVSHHPMNIPRYYLSLIDPTDKLDPIRKLAIPSTEELIISGVTGETTGDPYGDDKHNKGNGILHKYHILHWLLLLNIVPCIVVTALENELWDFPMIKP